LVEHDVIVSFSSINYSMKENNPVDSIRFFSKFNGQESFNISQEKVSYMIPRKFQDINLRIFTRDPSKMLAIQKAFRRYLSQITKTETVVDPTVSVPAEYQNLVFSKRRRMSSCDNGST
ncbi:SAM domain and HD domain protein, partial [Rhizopus stolonifer]